MIMLPKMNVQGGEIVVRRNMFVFYNMLYAELGIPDARTSLMALYKNAGVCHVSRCPRIKLHDDSRR